MNPLQQVVERKRLAARHHDLAVEQKLGGLQFKGGLDQFGKIAGQVFAGLGTELDLAVVAGKQAAEAIPFRLILPFFALRDGIDRARFHRGKLGGFRQGFWTR